MSSSAPQPKTPEEKLNAILAYVEKQDHRERRRAFMGAFRQLLSLVSLGIFLYAGWYMYAHQDELLDTVLRKSTDYALQAAEDRQATGATGSTMQVLLDEQFVDRLTDRLLEKAVEQQKQQGTQSAAQPES